MEEKDLELLLDGGYNYDEVNGIITTKDGGYVPYVKVKTPEGEEKILSSSAPASIHKREEERKARLGLTGYVPEDTYTSLSEKRFNEDVHLAKKEVEEFSNYKPNETYNQAIKNAGYYSPEDWFTTKLNESKDVSDQEKELLLDYWENGQQELIGDFLSANKKLNDYAQKGIQDTRDEVKDLTKNTIAIPNLNPLAGPSFITKEELDKDREEGNWITRNIKVPAVEMLDSIADSIANSWTNIVNERGDGIDEDLTEDTPQGRRRVKDLYAEAKIAKENAAKPFIAKKVQENEGLLSEINQQLENLEAGPLSKERHYLIESRRQIRKAIRDGKDFVEGNRVDSNILTLNTLGDVASFGIQDLVYEGVLLRGIHQANKLEEEGKTFEEFPPELQTLLKSTSASRVMQEMELEYNWMRNATGGAAESLKFVQELASTSAIWKRVGGKVGLKIAGSAIGRTAQAAKIKAVRPLTRTLQGNKKIAKLMDAKGIQDAGDLVTKVNGAGNEVIKTLATTSLMPSTYTGALADMSSQIELQVGDKGEINVLTRAENYDDTVATFEMMEKQLTDLLSSEEVSDEIKEEAQYELEQIQEMKKNTLVPPGRNPGQSFVNAFAGNFLENVSEAYVGKGIDKVGKALLKSKAVKSIQNKYLSSGVFAKLKKAGTLSQESLERLGKKYPILGEMADVTSSPVGEFPEEIFVTAMPKPFQTKGEREQELEDLVSADFYVNVAAISAMQSGFMKTLGGSYGLVSRLANREAREERRKQIKDFQENIASLAKADPRTVDSLLSLTGGTTGQGIKYEVIAQKYEQEGENEKASNMRLKLLEHQAAEAMRLGTLPEYEKALRSLLESQKVTAKQKTNLALALSTVENLKEVAAKYPNNASEIWYAKNREQENRRLASQMAEEANTFDVEEDWKAFKKANDISEDTSLSSWLDKSMKNENFGEVLQNLTEGNFAERLSREIQKRSHEALANHYAKHQKKVSSASYQKSLNIQKTLAKTVDNAVAKAGITEVEDIETLVKKIQEKNPALKQLSKSQVEDIVTEVTSYAKSRKALRDAKEAAVKKPQLEEAEPEVESENSQDEATVAQLEYLAERDNVEADSAGKEVITVQNLSYVGGNDETNRKMKTVLRLNPGASFEDIVKGFANAGMFPKEAINRVSLASLLSDYYQATGRNLDEELDDPAKAESLIANLEKIEKDLLNILEQNSPPPVQTSSRPPQAPPVVSQPAPAPAVPQPIQPAETVGTGEGKKIVVGTNVGFSSMVVYIDPETKQKIDIAENPFPSFDFHYLLDPERTKIGDSFELEVLAKEDWDKFLVSDGDPTSRGVITFSAWMAKTGTKENSAAYWDKVPMFMVAETPEGRKKVGLIHDADWYAKEVNQVKADGTTKKNTAVLEGSRDVALATRKGFSEGTIRKVKLTRNAPNLVLYSAKTDGAQAIRPLSERTDNKTRIVIDTDSGLKDAGSGEVISPEFINNYKNIEKKDRPYFVLYPAYRRADGKMMYEAARIVQYSSANASNVANDQGQYQGVGLLADVTPELEKVKTLWVAHAILNDIKEFGSLDAAKGQTKRKLTQNMAMYHMMTQQEAEEIAQSVRAATGKEIIEFRDLAELISSSIAIRNNKTGQHVHFSGDNSYQIRAILFSQKETDYSAVHHIRVGGYGFVMDVDPETGKKTFRGYPSNPKEKDTRGYNAYLRERFANEVRTIQVGSTFTSNVQPILEVQPIDETGKAVAVREVIIGAAPTAPVIQELPAGVDPIEDLDSEETFDDASSIPAEEYKEATVETEEPFFQEQVFADYSEENIDNLTRQFLDILANLGINNLELANLVNSLDDTYALSSLLVSDKEALISELLFRLSNEIEEKKRAKTKNEDLRKKLISKEDEEGANTETGDQENLLVFEDEVVDVQAIKQKFRAEVQEAVSNLESIVRTIDLILDNVPETFPKEKLAYLTYIQNAADNSANKARAVADPDGIETLFKEVSALAESLSFFTLEEDENGMVQDFNKTSIEHNHMKKLLPPLKRLLATIPDSKGDPSFLGFTKRYEFKEVYTSLMTVLSESGVENDFGAMMHVLRETADAQPKLAYFRSVADILEQSSDQLKRIFVTSLYKFPTNSHMVMITPVMVPVDEYGGMEVSPTLVNTQHYEVTNEGARNKLRTMWTANLIDQTDGGNFSPTYAQNLLQTLDKLLPPTVSITSQNQDQIRRQVLEPLGIVLSDSVWEEAWTKGIRNPGSNEYVALTAPTGLFGNKYGIAVYLRQVAGNQRGSNFVEENPKLLIPTRNNVIRSQVANLLSMEAKANPELNKTVVRDGTKDVSSVQYPNLFYETWKEIKNGKILRDKYSEQNFWIQLQEAAQDSSLLMNAFNNLKYGEVAIQALKDSYLNVGSGAADEISDTDLNRLHRHLFQMTQGMPATEQNIALREFMNPFLRNGMMDNPTARVLPRLRWAWFAGPTLSDKGRIVTMKSISYDILGDSNLIAIETDPETKKNSLVVTPLMKEILFDRMIMPELRRIAFELRRASERPNIHGHNAARFRFNSIPELNHAENSEGLRVKDWIESRKNSELSEQELIEEFRSTFYSGAVNAVETTMFNDTQNKEPNNKEYTSAGAGIRADGRLTGEIFQQLVNLDHKINYALFLQGMQETFVGDPSTYASKEHKIKDDTIVDSILSSLSIGDEMSKRMAALIAPGTVLANSENERYLKLHLADINDMSERIAELIFAHYPELSPEQKNAAMSLVAAARDKQSSNIARKKAKEKLGELYPKLFDYLDIETTDAQEYTTLKEHLTVMLAAGSIDKETYERIYKRTYVDRLGLDPQDISLILQPMKPVYTGFTLRDGVKVLNYVKSSSVPLIPGVHDSTSLGPLMRTMMKMEDETGSTVRASYHSANKVGDVLTENRINPLDLESLKQLTAPEQWDKMGQAMPSLWTKHVEVLPRKYFKIQQNNPYHAGDGKTSMVTMGTQITRILFGNNAIERLNSESPGKGTKLFERYNKVFEKLNEINEREVNKRLLTDPDSNSVFEGMNDVIATSLRSGSGLSAIDEALLDNRNFQTTATGEKVHQLPLWLSPSVEKIEQAVTAFFTNSIFVNKVPGSSYVVSSSAGMDKQLSMLADQSIIVDKTWGESEKRKLKGGEIILPARVFLNGKLVDFYKKNKEGKYIYIKEDPITGQLNLNMDKFEVNPQTNIPYIFEQFGYRIPTSSHSTGSNLKVVAIRPPYSGDSVIASPDLIAQMGQDHDNDKLTVYNYVTVYNRNTKRIEILTEENQEYFNENTSGIPLDKALITNELLNIYKEVYNSPSMSAVITRTVSTSKAAEHIKNLPSSRQIPQNVNLLNYNYQFTKFSQGRSGKEAIGIYAKTITLLSRIQQMPPEKRLRFNISRSYNLGGQIQSDFFSSVNTVGDTRTIADLLDERIQMSTDNAKLGLLGLAGLANKTAVGVDAYLSALGFDSFIHEGKEYSVSFSLHTNPIIQRLYKGLSNKTISQSVKPSLNNIIKDELSDLATYLETFSPEQAEAQGYEKEDWKRAVALAETVGLFEPTGTIIPYDIDLDPATLLTSTPGLEQTLKLLIAYTRIYQDSSYFTAISIGSDIKQLGKNVFEAHDAEESTGVVEDSFGNTTHLEAYKLSRDIGLINKIPEGFVNAIHLLRDPNVNGELVPSTYVGRAMDTAYKAFLKYSHSIFPYRSNFFSSTFAYLGHLPKPNFSRLNAEEKKAIKREMVKYFHSQDFPAMGMSVEEKAQDLFYSKDNLASYISKLKKQKHPAIVENAFIKAITKQVRTKPLAPGTPAQARLLEMADSMNMDEREMSILRESALQLFQNKKALPDRNGKPYSTRELIQDLFFHNLLSGNVIRMPQSIHHTLPLLELYEGTGISAKFRNTADLLTNPKRFTIEFLQNNPEWTKGIKYAKASAGNDFKPGTINPRTGKYSLRKDQNRGPNFVATYVGGVRYLYVRKGFVDADYVNESQSFDDYVMIKSVPQDGRAHYNSSVYIGELVEDPAQAFARMAKAKAVSAEQAGVSTSTPKPYKRGETRQATPTPQEDDSGFDEMPNMSWPVPSAPTPPESAYSEDQDFDFDAMPNMGWPTETELPNEDEGPEIDTEQNRSYHFGKGMMTATRTLNERLQRGNLSLSDLADPNALHVEFNEITGAVHSNPITRQVIDEQKAKDMKLGSSGVKGEQQVAGLSKSKVYSKDGNEVIDYILESQADTLTEDRKILLGLLKTWMPAGWRIEETDFDQDVAEGALRTLGSNVIEYFRDGSDSDNSRIKMYNLAIRYYTLEDKLIPSLQSARQNAEFGTEEEVKNKKAALSNLITQVNREEFNEFYVRTLIEEALHRITARAMKEIEKNPNAAPERYKTFYKIYRRYREKIAHDLFDELQVDDPNGVMRAVLLSEGPLDLQDVNLLIKKYGEAISYLYNTDNPHEILYRLMNFQEFLPGVLNMEPGVATVLEMMDTKPKFADQIDDESFLQSLAKNFAELFKHFLKVLNLPVDIKTKNVIDFVIMEGMAFTEHIRKESMNYIHEIKWNATLQDVKKKVTLEMQQIDSSEISLPKEEQQPESVEPTPVPPYDTSLYTPEIIKHLLTPEGKVRMNNVLQGIQRRYGENYSDNPSAFFTNPALIERLSRTYIKNTDNSIRRGTLYDYLYNYIVEGTTIPSFERRGYPAGDTVYATEEDMYLPYSSGFESPHPLLDSYVTKIVSRYNKPFSDLREFFYYAFTRTGGSLAYLQKLVDQMSPTLYDGLSQRVETFPVETVENIRMKILDSLDINDFLFENQNSPALIKATFDLERGGKAFASALKYNGEFRDFIEKTLPSISKQVTELYPSKKDLIREEITEDPVLLPVKEIVMRVKNRLYPAQLYPTREAQRAVDQLNTLGYGSIFTAEDVGIPGQLRIRVKPDVKVGNVVKAVANAYKADVDIASQYGLKASYLKYLIALGGKSPMRLSTFVLFTRAERAVAIQQALNC